MKIYGIDTIEFGIEIENYDKNLEQFLYQLENLKNNAQSQYKEIVINLGGINFIVKPKGQGFYKYKLECEDFHICFMSKKVNKNSPIYVRFISKFIWQYSFENAYNLFQEWFFKTFKVDIITNKLSRLDICCDTDEIEFKANDSKRIVSRARKREIQNVDSENYEGKVFSGFTIAKGSPLMCRIYNKTMEIKKSNKVWFKDIWQEFKWNNKDVWRIEFQARREILKELKIEKVEDIYINYARLWIYYTDNWFTMRIPQKDTNMSRWKIDNRWKKIQNISNQYKIQPLSREIVKKGDIDTLLNLCIGSMTSISAIKGYDNERDTFLYISENMKKRNKENNTNYKIEVEKKMNRYI